jgi:hypothetical protein
LPETLAKVGEIPCDEGHNVEYIAKLCIASITMRERRLHLSGMCQYEDVSCALEEVRANSSLYAFPVFFRCQLCERKDMR